MDHLIRPINEGAVNRPTAVRRRSESEERPFDLEFGGEAGEFSQAARKPETSPQREDTPISQRPADEAGGRVDVTA